MWTSKTLSCTPVYFLSSCLSWFLRCCPNWPSPSTGDSRLRKQWRSWWFKSQSAIFVGRWARQSSLDASIARFSARQLAASNSTSKSRIHLFSSWAIQTLTWALLSNLLTCRGMSSRWSADFPLKMSKVVMRFSSNSCWGSRRNATAESSSHRKKTSRKCFSNSRHASRKWKMRTGAKCLIRIRTSRMCSPNIRTHFWTPIQLTDSYI